MSEFADHLPLSQRRAFDESRVSGDWRPVTAQCLTSLVEVLRAQPTAMFDSPSLRPGWSVREVTAELIWRADSSSVELAVEQVRSVFRDALVPDPDVARLAASSSDQLIGQLRDLASRRADRVGRRGVGDLANVVSRSYEVSRAVHHDLDLPAIATGAVCLARMLSAPLPIRAALAGRSLVATDAGWTVGRGRPILAPAEHHVLFLYGRRASLPGH